MASLINNFMTTGSFKPQSQIQTTQEAPKKPKPHFDIEHELNNRTFIKPLKGKGKLVSENIFNAPAVMFKDSIYNIKAMKHAMKGEANDHELGKLNDVGLKLGGLAIAGYLFTKKQTPLTKGMEFVGLGSFLASMALWPKIAIQLPAYLIHGINVQQKYEDSFGRKKPFYQDPQFIPWDLYTDKQIQKIGNRLGVDKNIPNRRDAIQEKMKKIAIQNNTLWMLTAGFATPVMSALICNQTEPYLGQWLNNRQNKKADKIITNIDNYAQKFQTNSVKRGLEQIINLYGDKPVDDELINRITNAFTEKMDPVTAESFKTDLKEMMTTKTFIIDTTKPKAITKNLTKLLQDKSFSPEVVRAIIPDEEAMFKLFEQNNFINSNAEGTTIKKVSNHIMKAIQENVTKYNAQHSEAEQLDFKYISKLIRSNKAGEKPIDGILLQASSAKFTTEIQAKLRNLAKVFDTFIPKNNALDEYAIIKTGSAPETVIANYWNNISNDLLKTLGINAKEMEKVRFDRNLTGQLLRGKIEHIVSNDELYKKVMKDLISKVEFLDQQIKPSDISIYNEKVDTLFDEFGNFLKDKQFHRTSRAVIGVNNDCVGTLKNLQKKFVEERILGVKSSFYRLINTLDFYRRIAVDVNNMESLKKYPREVREELIELCKIMTLQGHSSDSATKFYMLRNPHPSDDMSDVVVRDGKVVNAHYGKAAANATTDIPVDKFFYQRAMQLMFEEKLDRTTAGIVESSKLKSEIPAYRDQILNIIGGENYFAKPFHRIRPQNGAGSDLKFLLTGIAPDELFFKAGQQAFNTRKWLKIFGTFGGALLGVTVLAQFFFGRMPNPAKKVGNK